LNYEMKRENLYGPMRNLFTWDFMYGSEYALADIHIIPKNFCEEIRLATEKLGKVFAKTVFYVQNCPDQIFEVLGIPKEAYQAIRTAVFLDTATTIGRFDFARTQDGLKMLEFNADTPTSIVEAFFVNNEACQFFGVNNPNYSLDLNIETAFFKTIKQYQKLGYPTETIVFSALGWHDEDRITVEFLLQKSGLKGKFVALEDLRVYEDRLCYWEDGPKPIDVWYRLHALEKLAEEKDSDGYSTGAHVLELVAHKKLALINPPSAFIAQTKALQALIWNLHEIEEFYTAQEHETISKYMLPTYLENKFLGVHSYVVKPVYGREGGAVSIFSSEGTLITSDKEEAYWDQPMIYQQTAELEKIEVTTLKGPYTGRGLWGSFLIGGHASGICLRVGELITGNLSFYLPIGIENI
jgi:glutathionylspermidine synthase